MRKLKLQVQITVNGLVAGPNGEMDWTAFEWDNELKKYVGELTEEVDCIVLGRKLAEGFIPYWTSHPEQEGAEKFIKTNKVVFTKTLEVSEWERTILAKGDLVEEINRIKNQNGKDIIAYGGVSFVSALIKNGLVDEFFLFVNPSAIGVGMPIFGDLDARLDLRLIEAIPFECGMAILRYEPKKG
jgi:dihydrofolate reductase